MYPCHATAALLVGFVDSIQHTLVLVASHHQRQQQHQCELDAVSGDGRHHVSALVNVIFGTTVRLSIAAECSQHHRSIQALISYRLARQSFSATYNPVLHFTRRQHGCQGHDLVLADALVIASIMLA